VEIIFGSAFVIEKKNCTFAFPNDGRQKKSPKNYSAIVY
jgi:hypothetical protein